MRRSNTHSPTGASRKPTPAYNASAAWLPRCVLTTTAFTRYVRVTVRADLPMAENIALLGHELMHAVEVADASGVRDELSFHHHYESIGRPNHRGRVLLYDTRAAIETGLRVAVEWRATTAHRPRTRER